MIENKYFKFDSADGKTKISAKIWYDDQQTPKAILQIVHGMVEYKERYDLFARFMAENGFLVCAHDHLGHGDSVTSTDQWGYMTETNPSNILVRDMHHLRRLMEKRYNDLPYFILGHSMGSYVLRKYLAIYGKGLSGAIVMGTGFMSPNVPAMAIRLCKAMAKVKGWNYRSEFIQNMTYDKYYKEYDLTGANPLSSWLTRDPEIVTKYYADPKCTYRFTLTGYKALFEAVKYSCTPKNIAAIPVSIPILLISGQDDPVGSMGKGVLQVEKLFKDNGLSVTTRLYPEARHEVLNEINKEEVYSDILNWINAQ